MIDYMRVVYVDFHDKPLMTVVDWPNERPPKPNERVFAYTNDECDFGCIAIIDDDIRPLVKGKFNTEWIITVTPLERPSVQELLDEERAERDLVLSVRVRGHQKVSSFGDDTCSCGFDGWPCGRESV